MKTFKRRGEVQPAGHQGRLLPHLIRDERGSVAIWVGLALITFIGCAGMAVDTARGYMVKARLSQALDAAALAGAKSLLSDTRDDDIEMLFDANFNADAFSATVVGPTIVADTAKNTVKVSATATIDTTLMSVLGFTTMTVAAEATAIRAINGLDVVISMDMSGSMCDPCSKIQAAQNAANVLVNTLYNDPNPKKVTINSNTYSLLNIGLVPWAGKVNVMTNSVVSGTPSSITFTPETPASTASYTDPVTGEAGKTQVYRTNVSDVLLLSPPPTGWTGGVYARYVQDNDQTNDADLTLGYPTMGGKKWVGYEPIPPFESEPISGAWDSTNGGTYGSTNWTGKAKLCHSAYWNDDKADPNHPSSVSNKPSYWKVASTGFPSTYVAEDTSIPIEPEQADCTQTPVQGILPLQEVDNKQKVLDAIAGLYTGTPLPSNGYTNAPQGLFWAYEVLMPGAPFSEAKESVPFKRTQAIVLLTDGELTGHTGDAYKGVFGHYTTAGTTTSYGNLTNGKKNNYNNRFLQLAASIKGSNPDQGVKIFVVQYKINNSSLTTLLKQVATQPNAPYYFYAPGDAELESAFKQIAASLSVLRLEQ